MSVDDDLFAPIGAVPAKIDQGVIDAIKIALTGQMAVDFVIDPKVNFTTYETVADLIDADKTIHKYVAKFVARNAGYNTRPSNALDAKELFRLIHTGQETFWFGGMQKEGEGLVEIKVANWFSIDNRMPIIGVRDTKNNCVPFEWWIVGLMGQFLGHQNNYTFATHAEADKYFHTP